METCLATPAAPTPIVAVVVALVTVVLGGTAAVKVVPSLCCHRVWVVVVSEVRRRWRYVTKLVLKIRVRSIIPVIEIAAPGPAIRGGHDGWRWVHTRVTIVVGIIIVIVHRVHIIPPTACRKQVSFRRRNLARLSG